MSKLFNIVFLPIAILCNNYSYSSEFIKYNEEELTISDFSRSNLSKYKEIDSSNGSIYMINSEGERIYPTFNGYKCYDLQTEINEVRAHNTLLQNILQGGNLVVQTLNDNDNNTYYVNDVKNIKQGSFLSIVLPSNTNIIIPRDVTVIQNDVTFYVGAGNNNVNLFILGTLTNKHNYTYINSFFYSDQQNCNVFIGPKATVSLNNINHDTMFYLNNTNSSIVLYPGCTLNANSVLQNVWQETNLINQYCTLYLNRYVEQNTDSYNQIKGIISPNANIVYPIHLQNSYTMENINNNNMQFIKNNYFPNLYWKKEQQNYSVIEHTCNNDYFFEDSSTILLSTDQEGRKVFSLNPTNKFLKYDIQLSNNCMVESGKYSFREFVNNATNYDKYINTDTLEELFTNGKTYYVNNEHRTGLLNNIPNEIYPGLIGNKDIVINYYNMYPNSNTCTMHGCIPIKYTGNICCMPGITTIVFKQSTVSGILSTKGFKSTILRDGVLECQSGRFGRDISEIKVKDKTYTKTNSDLFYEFFNYDDEGIFEDYRCPIDQINRYNLDNVTWNLYDYTDEDENNINIFEECFKDGDTYKPHGSNKIGLVNNIPIDILNYEIKANLSGNKPITIYSNKENSHITFSGNNSSYTGVVSLSPNIRKVYFNDETSAVKVNTGVSKSTVTNNNNNILQTLIKNSEIEFYYGDETNNKLIDENTSIKLSDIALPENDNRDTIKNIGKYNVTGTTWNIDTIEDCFIDGTGLLNNFPSTIKANIIGSKNIVINPNATEIILLGNSTGYYGKITIPETATRIQTSVNFKTENLIFNNDIPFYIDGKQINIPEVDNQTEDVKQNTDAIELNITDNNWQNNTFSITSVDNEHPGKIIIKGDNESFNEMVINVVDTQTVNCSEKSGLKELEIGKLKLIYNKYK
ncbi:MAG: hypothetical protein IJ848_00785 [Alphaproteobacteria bacterium]|nr:hypothetical protein [Alphaproteobacteria bacterium]